MMNRLVSFARSTTGAHRAGALAGLALGATALAAANAQSPAAEAEAERRDRKPLGRSMMYARDPDGFAKKWKKFSTDGMDKLLVIADFDFTLTTSFKPSGERGHSSHGILMLSDGLDPAVKAANREMFLKYYPIEQSPTLSHAEKLPFIIEWWTKEHDCIVQHKLTKRNILEAVQANTITFREGFHDIFAVLTQQNVPTLIFSAGLYDVIHAVLDKEYASPTEGQATISTTTTNDSEVPSNVHVISNMMQFDDTGTVVGFEGKLIHSLNKNASVVLDTPFWQQCQSEKRRNVLLLGDSLGDARMADGLECEDDEIVRIGFLNDRVSEKLDVYLQHFDVVLTNDSSMLPIELLLHQVQK